ncbi:MAG: TadE family protein [Pseudomonadota bacterium]
MSGNVIAGLRSLLGQSQQNDKETSIRRGDRGASLIEFALIVPFLLSLTIGIVEMSNVFYIRNILNEAVRDATRRFAIGALDKVGTEDLIQQRVTDTIGFNGKVLVTETPIDDDNTDVTVSVTVPLQSLLLFQSLSGGFVTIGGSNPNLTFSATSLKY